MIDPLKLNILLNYKKSLRDISVDDSDKSNLQYMTQSYFVAVDFDDVKDNYSIENDISIKELRSNDALVILNDINHFVGHFIFIEFKNGDVSSRFEREKIRTKISESLLIFNDIFDETLSYDRKSIDYILVYNKTKNIKFENERYSALTGIGKILASASNMEYNINGFDRYRLFFHNVKTINEDEFINISKSLENGTYNF